MFNSIKSQAPKSVGAIGLFGTGFDTNTQQRIDAVKRKLTKLHATTDENGALTSQAYALSIPSIVLEKIGVDTSTNVPVRIAFTLASTPENVSNTIRKIPNEFKTDVVHTALIIGDTILEWNQSNLCIPKSCVGSGILMVFDVGTLPTSGAPISRLNQLCATIVEYNVNQAYSKKHQNSQHFVDACLKDLEINNTLPYIVQGHITQVLMNGTIERQELLPDTERENFVEEFVSAAEAGQGILRFASHKELVHLCLHFMSKTRADFFTESQTQEEFRDLREILKGFDRAFRMKEGNGVPFPENPFDSPGRTLEQLKYNETGYYDRAKNFIGSWWK
jgi:hypothetical protein